MSFKRLNNTKEAPVYGTREQINWDASYPKNLKHWFSEFGIHFDEESFTGRSYRRAHLANCVEPIRHFRVLPQIGLLQICNGNFDRWANSVGAEVSLPKSRKEFVAAIELMLGSAKLVKPDMNMLIDFLERDIQRYSRDISRFVADYGWLFSQVDKYGVHGKDDRDLVRRVKIQLRGKILRRRIAIRYLRYLKQKVADSQNAH